MSALEKRIKRHLHGTPQQALVRFPKGFADVCLSEVQSHVPGATLEDNAIRLTDVAYRDLCTLPLKLTTAREILWEVGKGKAETIKQLKARVAEVAFDLIFEPKTKLSLRVNSTASRLFHEGKVEDLVTRSLADRGLVVATDAPHLLDVRLKEDYLILSLGLSGRPLHWRGYKTELKGTASVKEDVAAAAIRAALGDYRPDHVWVPFAGSGTLGFEAILALGAVPPAAFGLAMSQDSWLCTPKATLTHARKKLLEAATKSPPVTFVELDPAQSAHLAKNAAAFAPYATVHVATADFFTVPSPQAARLFVPLNPPYGERLGQKGDAATLYKKIARKLDALSGEVRGFVFCPTEAVADGFSATLGSGWSADKRAFNHGGRNTYQVIFSRSV